MKILRQHFARGFFEMGSGVSLQPLVRFSDRFSDFLFVDFAVDGREAQAALRAAVDALSLSARHGHEHLTLESMTLHDAMSPSDFELAMPLHEVLPRAREAFRAEDLKGLERFDRAVRAARPRQWGLQASLVRHVRLVGGATRSRALTLRLVGGEGLLTFVGMGGLDAPPSYIGTVQTGLAELPDGPFAALFRAQHASGGPVPDIWIRGSWPHAPRGPSAPPSLEAAGPFKTVAQEYSAWWGDPRRWTNAHQPARAVRAWAVDAWSQPSPIRVGKHRIVSASVSRRELLAADSVCIGHRFARSLGLARERRHTIIPDPEVGRPHEPLAGHLERWSRSNGFRYADRAVYIPTGFEDEVEVILDWLRQVSGPQVNVHLHRRLDFEAAELAMAGLSPRASATESEARRKQLHDPPRSPPGASEPGDHGGIR